MSNFFFGRRSVIIKVYDKYGGIKRTKGQLVMRPSECSRSESVYYLETPEFPEYNQEGRGQIWERGMIPNSKEPHGPYIHFSGKNARGNMFFDFKLCFEDPKLGMDGDATQSSEPCGGELPHIQAGGNFSIGCCCSCGNSQMVIMMFSNDNSDGSDDDTQPPSSEPPWAN